MLSEYLDKTTMRLLDFVMEFPEPFGVDDITSISHKNGAEFLQKLAGMEIITCVNPEAPAGEWKYKENQASGIFALLVKLDFEFSTFALKQKRQKMRELDALRPREDNRRSHEKKVPPVAVEAKKEIPLEELAKLVNPDS